MIQESKWSVQQTRSGFILKNHITGSVHPEKFATKDAARRRARSLREEAGVAANAMGDASSTKITGEADKTKKNTPPILFQIIKRLIKGRLQLK